jgi:hypothetical protein
VKKDHTKAVENLFVRIQRMRKLLEEKGKCESLKYRLRKLEWEVFNMLRKQDHKEKGNEKKKTVKLSYKTKYALEYV